MLGVYIILLSWFVFAFALNFRWFCVYGFRLDVGLNCYCLCLVLLVWCSCFLFCLRVCCLFDYVWFCDFCCFVFLLGLMELVRLCCGVCLYFGTIFSYLLVCLFGICVGCWTTTWILCQVWFEFVWATWGLVIWMRLMQFCCLRFNLLC